MPSSLYTFYEPRPLAPEIVVDAIDWITDVPSESAKTPCWNGSMETSKAIHCKSWVGAFVPRIVRVKMQVLVHSHRSCIDSIATGSMGVWRIRTDDCTECIAKDLPAKRSSRCSFCSLTAAVPHHPNDSFGWIVSNAIPHPVRRRPPASVQPMISNLPINRLFRRSSVWKTLCGVSSIAQRFSPIIKRGSRCCKTWSRRDWLQWGSLACFGLGACARPSEVFGYQPHSKHGWIPRAKNCILLWLDGGPSHLEMFDPKPAAPIEVRGPFGAIATDVPGIAISELLPETSKICSDIAIVRSMTSPLGEHGLANHYMLTGYKPGLVDHPSYGSVLHHWRNSLNRSASQNLQSASFYLRTSSFQKRDREATDFSIL